MTELITYDWTKFIVGNEREDDWAASEIFFSKHVPTSFRLRSKLTSRNLMDISVEKTCHEPAKATISVKVDGIFERDVTLENWKDVHIFKDIQLCNMIIVDKSNRRVRTILCNILWYGRIVYRQYEYFKDYYLNQELSDFTIVIGSDELPVHKMVLGVQSSKFKAMFTSNMIEAKENRVVIADPGLSVELMKDFLRYLYTGWTKAETDSDVALRMYAVAHEYDVQSLKNVCEASLLKNLNTTNVLDILIVADMMSAEGLRQRMLEYMVANKEVIVLLPGFKEFMKENNDLSYEFTVLLANAKISETNC